MRAWVLLLLGFLLATVSEAQVSCQSAPSNVLGEFTSDNCSAFPDGLWRHCCVIHDVQYWMGGTQQERFLADAELGACVNRRVPLLGWIMRAFVMMSGVPDGNTTFAWGYGWEKQPDYCVRTPEQQAQVARELQKLEESGFAPPGGPRAGKIRKDFPSLSGSYCLDEIYHRMKKLPANGERDKLGRLRIHFAEIIANASAGWVKLQPNFCRGTLWAHFSINAHHCRDPQKRDRLTEFLQSIAVSGDCKEYFDDYERE